MSKEKAQRTIRYYAKKGVQELRLSGGEPTLRQDLPDLIRFAKSIGVKRVSIITNAILLNKDLCLLLKEAGLNFANVSMHCHNENLSKQLYGEKSSFNSSVQGIKNLIEIKIPVNINLVIVRQNYIMLRNICAFFDMEFKKLESIIIMWPIITERLTKHTDVLPRIKEVKPYLREALYYLRDSNIKFLLKALPLCFVDEQFRKTISYNHVKTNKHIIEFRKSNVCKLCKESYRCKGLMKEYFAIFGDEGLEAI